jgi:hypothetical protein
MLTTIEKMIKNIKNKINNSTDYEMLNNHFQYGLGICSTAGNLNVIDKKKYDDFVNYLKTLVNAKIVNIYKVDLDIANKLGIDCSVRIDTLEELKLLYNVLKVVGKIKTKYDVETMNNYPYVVDLMKEEVEFVGTTNDYNAIIEIGKTRTILPFNVIYKK